MNNRVGHGRTILFALDIIGISLGVVLQSVAVLAFAVAALFLAVQGIAIPHSLLSFNTSGFEIVMATYVFIASMMICVGFKWYNNTLQKINLVAKTATFFSLLGKHLTN